MPLKLSWPGRTLRACRSISEDQFLLLKGRRRVQLRMRWGGGACTRRGPLWVSAPPVPSSITRTPAKQSNHDVNFKRCELAVRALKHTAVQGGDFRSGSSQIRSQAVSLCPGSRGGGTEGGCQRELCHQGPCWESLLVFGWVG